MKIAILTLPLHTNYGGILQAYALQTVLERMGHNVQVLNKDRHVKTRYWRIPFRILNKCLGNNTIIFYEKYVNNIIDIKETYTSQFVSKYIKSLFFHSFNNINFNDFDAIVVGSDQVWSPLHGKSLGGSVINAFLPFAKDLRLKRIAYAASFGKDSWEYSVEETKQAKYLIKFFNSVSIRENSGVELCKTYLCAKSVKTLDPTLLLNSEDYVNLIPPENLIRESNGLLVYMIDNTNEKSHIVSAISSLLHLTPNIVNSRAEDISGKKYDLSEMIQPSVESWLNSFRNASYVVTDSFHACVFSILFRKNFIAIGNKERGLIRFVDLLSSFGLENRLILNSSELTDQLINSKIDYIKVYEKLNKMRVFSFDYLAKALS